MNDTFFALSSFMTRINLKRSRTQPYFVTTKSNHSDWFSLSLPEVWSMFQSSLQEAYERHRIELIACILLPNCYHLFLRTPEANLDKFMYELNKRLSQKIRHATGRINKIFAGPYKRSLIESTILQKDCFRYLAQASLRTGCAGRCENYSYVILKPNKIDEEKSPEFFQWLNEPMSDDENRVFQAKLKRSIFKEEISKTSRRKISRIL